MIVRPYTRLVAGLLFPLHERLKGHDTLARRKALERSQWWPRERIEADQIANLRGFLARIGQGVPYWHELFAERSFEPEAVRSLADLRKLPLLTKSIIRSRTGDMKARSAGPLKRFNTGGSSGEPLVFFMGRDRISHDVAAKWRATRWWGVDIGDRELVVWGSPIEVAVQDRVRSLRDWILRSELLPAFEMSADKLDDFVGAIRQRRPRMLFGYPSALTLIARHAERRNVRLDNLGIRVAFVTSEKLYDDQRETIGRVFGCPVANGYGGRDAGFIAHECPHGGMHISAEDVIVEIVDAEGEPVPRGASGEIVVTHLATAEFPFVRYRTGDMGILDDRACECGRGLPLLKEVQGRTTDFVVAADGTIMHGLALIYVVRDLPGIEQFKIVQESRLLTRVQLSSKAPIADAILDRIRAGFRARLGQGVDVSIEQVEHIEAEKSGKFRYVTSKVDATASTPVEAVQ